jgi:hypothetical protein
VVVSRRAVGEAAHEVPNLVFQAAETVAQEAEGATATLRSLQEDGAVVEEEVVAARLGGVAAVLS